MSKPIEGHVKCPFCGGTAVVLRNSKANRLRYFRCGESIRGIHDGCGTVQIYGPTGQAWIDRHIQPIGSQDPVQEPVADPVPDAVDPVPDPVADPVTKPEKAPAGTLKGRGLLSLLLAEDE